MRVLLTSWMQAEEEDEAYESEDEADDNVKSEARPRRSLGAVAAAVMRSAWVWLQVRPDKCQSSAAQNVWTCGWCQQQCSGAALP